MSSLFARNLRKSCLLLLVVVSAAGCGKSAGPKPVQVTGTVTRGGRPVDSLLVFFEPDKGKPSVGKTGADGKFKLASGAEQGAVPGKYTVYFQFMGKTPEEELAYQAGQLKLPDDQLVATTTYGSKDSKLKVTVSEKDPQEIALELE